MLRFYRRFRRARILRQASPRDLEAFVARHAPVTRYLDQADRAKLLALIRIFLAEKSFEGAGGLELTDEMRVAVAARACLLVLHRAELDAPLYPDLDAIVVYPDTYRAPHVERDGHVVIEGEQHRLGESWQRGVVVLSWRAVSSGGSNPNDGHDVVLHEFAHQLDAEDGGMDGAPELDTGERYRAWAEVLGHEYRELLARIERRAKTSIDRYGAKSPPEFFAVVTEAFFEKPLALQRQHPELYAELAHYFRIDPAALVIRARRARQERPPSEE